MVNDDPAHPVGQREALRRALAGLGNGDDSPSAVPILARPGTRIPLRVGDPRVLPAPPSWAANSVVEDGGVTHELVSPVHPVATCLGWSEVPGFTCPTDVSVSVFDRPRGRRWSRTAPTIQLEGGSYTITEARRLVRALEELIAAAI